MRGLMARKLVRVLAKLKAGDVATFRVEADGKARDVKVTTVKASDLFKDDGFSASAPWVTVWTRCVWSTRTSSWMPPYAADSGHSAASCASSTSNRRPTTLGHPDLYAAGRAGHAGHAGYSRRP